MWRTCFTADPLTDNLFYLHPPVFFEAFLLVSLDALESLLEQIWSASFAKDDLSFVFVFVFSIIIGKDLSLNLKSLVQKSIFRNEFVILFIFGKSIFGGQIIFFILNVYL